MKAYVAGVGMTRFEKPETRDWQYWDMVREAGGVALADARIGYDEVEQVPVGYFSGGLISKGHPLGATGVAQTAELVWQRRGAAARRQVEGARVGLAHNIGLGGAAVVTVLKAV